MNSPGGDGSDGEGEEFTPEEEARRNAAAFRICAFAKMLPVRRRYLRHLDGMKDTLKMLEYRTSGFAAAQLQNWTRRMAARAEFLALRARADRYRDECIRKRKRHPAYAFYDQIIGQKGRDGKTPHIPREVMYQREQEHFVTGCVHYIHYRYEEAIDALDDHAKRFPNDRTGERLLERCKLGKHEQAERAKAWRKEQIKRQAQVQFERQTAAGGAGADGPGRRAGRGGATKGPAGSKGKGGRTASNAGSNKSRASTPAMSSVSELAPSKPNSAATGKNSRGSRSTPTLPPVRGKR